MRSRTRPLAGWLLGAPPLVACGSGGTVETRSIPGAIRRALRARDRHCCYPGCTSRIFLHGHHVEHWLHGGETKIRNLVHLCWFHHHLVHEGGFRVEAGPDGTFVFRAPDGAVIPRTGRRPLVECDAFDVIVDAHREDGLDIDADTNLPTWDGGPRDLSDAVGDLFG